MKKHILLMISMMFLAPWTHAAPYYTGVGCDEEGLRCTFGTPSGRVLEWSRKGTVQEMGERCEKFINEIDARRAQIAQRRNLDLKYKKFTAQWSNEIQADGRAKIICRIELHSELPEVKIEGKKFKNYNWVCDDENSPGICRHYMRECEEARREALKGEDVLDATIYLGGALLQGMTCTVVTATVK